MTVWGVESGVGGEVFGGLEEGGRRGGEVLGLGCYAGHTRRRAGGSCRRILGDALGSRMTWKKVG